VTRVCPRHRVKLLVVGDELRCPAAPHQVVGWLVVDRHGRVLALGTGSGFPAVRARVAAPGQAGGGKGCGGLPAGGVMRLLLRCLETALQSEHRKLSEDQGQEPK